MPDKQRAMDDYFRNRGQKFVIDIYGKFVDEKTGKFVDEDGNPSTNIEVRRATSVNEASKTARKATQQRLDKTRSGKKKDSNQVTY